MNYFSNSLSNSFLRYFLVCMHLDYLISLFKKKKEFIVVSLIRSTKIDPFDYKQQGMSVHYLYNERLRKWRNSRKTCTN